MERDENYKLLIFFILIVSFVYSAQAQENSSSTSDVRYSQINVEFSINQNKFLTDTATFNYDLGLGLALEKETLYSSKFAVLYNGGVNLYHSRSISDKFSARILTAQAKIGGKYYISDKIALYGGGMGYYGFLVQFRDGTMKSWETLDDVNHFNGGIFLGVDITLKSWSSLRFVYALTPRLSSFQLSITVTPSIVFD